MVWDKDLPDGDLDISLGDDDLRTNNAALELAFDLEHEFTTGSGQTGRHHFGNVTLAQIPSVLSGVADGSVAFVNDVRTGKYVWYVYDGSAWGPVDLGTEDVPRLDEQSQFDVCQFVKFEALAGAEIVSGTPDVLNIDLSKSAHRTYTLTSNTQIAAFTNDVASYGTTVILELTQPTPAVTVTYAASVFQAAFGVEPVIGNNDGDRSVLQFVKQNSGKWLVAAQPAVADI